MNLMNKIRNSLFGTSIENHEVPEYKEISKLEMEEKVNAVYGDDELTKQRLFEKWAVKEQWILKSEAIPLVLGLDPENSDWQRNEQQTKEIDELFEHARTCINQGMSLSVIDKEQEEEQWQVTPAEFYCWASVSRVDISQQLATLMEFIISTVKTSSFTTDKANVELTSPEAANLSQNFNQTNEKVLGAALAILLNYPEQCKNSRGRFKVNSIVSLLLEKQAVWFDEKELNLSQSAIEDLLNKWISSLD